MNPARLLLSGVPDPVAPAPSAPPRVAYISWAGSCSRSDHTARELGGRSHMVYLPRFGSRVLTVLFKYAGQWIKTARILRQERADVVFVMSPPVIAALPAFWYAWRTGGQVVIDAHTAAFLHPRWRRLQWLQRALCRRAATTLVHNAHLAECVRAAGGHATLVPDVPITFEERQAFPRPAGFTIAVVCSFNDDEPLREILEAATMLPAVQFFMTGDPHHFPASLKARVPANVTLTGFLSTPAYGGLLVDADAVMALTTRDHTMLRGAYEAIYQGTPVIVSDWPLLREAFPEGGVHVDSTPAAIAGAVRAIQADPDRFRAEARRLRQAKLARWESTRAALVDHLTATPRSLTQEVGVTTESRIPAAGQLRQMRALGKTAKKSAIWDMGGRLSSQATLFFVSVFLARMLSPADFGITAAARFFVTLASRLTQLGLNASLVRMKHVRPEHASSVFVVNVIAGVTAFVALVTASPLLGRVFHSPDVTRVLPVTALVFLITPLGTVASAMLERDLRYRETTVIQWMDNVSGALMSLLLAWLGYGYWSLVLGALGGAVVSTAAKMYVSPWRPSVRFSAGALQDTLGFGLGFQAKALLNFGARNLDNLVVGRVLGMASLGFYDKAYGLMNQVTDRLAFDASLMRIFAVISDDEDRFRRALLKGTTAITIVMLPILAFCAVAAEPLVVVLFGARWLPAAGPFRVLSVAGMLRFLMRPIGSANDALGFVWLQTWNQLAYLTLVVVGVAVGAHWGLTAASVGVLLAVLINTILGIRIIVHHTAITARDLWRSIQPSLLMSIVVCTAVAAEDALLHRATSPSVLVSFGAMCATAAIVYLALVLWTPIPSVEEVVTESVDDIAPWVRRWVRVGVLAPEPASRAGVTTADAAPDSVSRV